MIDVIKFINDRYDYKFDQDQYQVADLWKVMALKDGRLVGDCEDYALTVLWYLSGESLMKFVWNLLTYRARIWYVTVPGGGGHALLEFDGKFIDQWKMEWTPKNVYEGVFDFKFYYNPLIVLRKLITGYYFKG
tara:strand:- start:53 stop:451 length:399 start_codon:yes stop_codon:yes gene_type:complete